MGSGTLRILTSWTRGKQPANIPMPFFGMGGRIVLTLYWWIYRLFFFPRSAIDDYEKTIKALDTPYKVQAWLYNNIKYRSDKDPQDHWQPAERTFKRKAGDCEDWAIFANECLKDKYNGRFLCMYDASSGHASYLITTKDTSGKEYTSMGTFGLIYHFNKDYRRIISNWIGFSDYTYITVKDENIKTIYSYDRSKDKEWHY